MSTTSPTPRLRGDHGASAVEYALGAALFVVALLVGVNWVQSAGETALGREADNIDYAANDSGVPSTTTSSSTTSTTSSSTTTSSTTTTSSSTTTTTTPAGSTTTTTSTTAPPSTTTTTTAPPTGEMTDLRITRASPSVVWWNGNSGEWKPNVTFDYRWRNGAHVTLSITEVTGNNKRTTTTRTVWMPDGSSTPEIGQYAMAKANSSDVEQLEVKVVQIRTQDASWNWRTFDVTGPTIIVAAPPRS